MPAFGSRLLLILLSVVLLCAGCEPSPEAPSGLEPTPTEESGEGAAVPAEPPPLPAPAEATLVAVGDIMMHTPQLPGARNPQTGEYDFSGFFAPLADTFTKADWAVANLETPIAGDQLGFPGYPRFNAPVALADAIAGAGFDIVSTANNHSLDQGFAGLAHTVQTLRDKGLHPIGTADTAEAAAALTVVEKNGIAGAFLSYTYGTNGIPVPEDKPYAIQLMDDKRMTAEIRKAKQAGVDVVVVSLHFGTEYQRMPNAEQRRVARLCIEAGADVVLGHHPHVVQPYETVQVTDDDGTARQGLIMYSLGNFISNQFGDYKEYGALLKVTFRKTFQADGTAVTTIAHFDAIPTWVHKYVSGGKSHYRVLSLDDLAQTNDDPLIPPRMLASLHEKAAEMNRHLETLTIEADRGKSVSSDVYR